MSVQQKIDRCLEDSNYHEALQLYEQNKNSLRVSPEWLIRLAKVYYSLTDYEKAIGVLRDIRWNSPAVNYEVKALEFKCHYLQGSRQTRLYLDQLKQLVSSEQFLPHHRATVEEFRAALEFREQTKNKIELKSEGAEYERLAKRENDASAHMLEAFPVYVVSQRWMNQWRKYVYLTEHDFERNSPGALSQFDILDHPCTYLHDPRSHKDYTNRYLINPADYVLVSKECWNFFASRYDGVPIVRYNICNFDKGSQNFTEVSLKQLTVAKYQRPDEKYQVQISRRDTWKGVEDKIKTCWGPGRLWKVYNKKNYRVNLSSILEEEDITGFELVYEVQQKGRWVLPDSDPDIPNRCGACSKTANLKLCQCRKTKYCNKACQQKDRVNHQRICQSNSMEFEMSSLIDRFDLGNNANYQGKKGLVGLKNIGNSCYMNTGIQCLSNTKQLTEYFMSRNFTAHLNSSNPLGSSGVLACAYAKLVRDMWSCRNSEISPFDFKKAFVKFSPQFSGFGQHDAQEFIASLLDGLHEDTNLVKKKPVVPEAEIQGKQDAIASQISHQSYLKRNQSYVSELMGGQFKSTVRCPTPKCGKVAVTFDHFMSVPLPIFQASEVEMFFIAKDVKSHVQKVSLPIKDTVGDVVTKLCKVFDIGSDSQIKVMQLSTDFEMVQEIDHKESGMALKHLKKKDSYIFCYEVKKRISDSKQTYVVEFITQSESKKEQIVSFPRLMVLPKSLDYETAQEAIWSCLSEYNKSTHITSPKQLFKLYLSSDKIKVSLKEELKLRTYKQSKKFTVENSAGEQLSLQECLTNFCKDEKLDQQDAWYCSKCKQHVCAIKKMDIYRTGKVIVLAIKRFRRDRKLKTQVTFPTILNLGPYILSTTCYYAGNTSKQAVEYELYAVINHSGTLTSGHYTAYCRNYLDARWYEFNDHKVDEIKQSEIVTKNAYVLFYRRRS